MKKIIISTLAVLLAAATIPSQGRATEVISVNRSGNTMNGPDITGRAAKKPEGMRVSPLSKDQFLADFGSVDNVKWTRSDNMDEATFMNHGIKTTAYYDDASNLIGTTVNKRFRDLPAVARRQIKKHYKGYMVNGVIFFDDNEYNYSDMQLFGNQFAGRDNYFVELLKKNDRIVLQVTPLGNITFFKSI
jgi:hypothetical protein